ncbi:hypothetical protein ABZ815_31890 [Nonomuraea sp. NPDC047529]|uniref:hypothetical protein n=1 Tax=Nonomuraea sp. NPDC047529 TaxID=3155623 RepID=UPI00340F2FA3
MAILDGSTRPAPFHFACAPVSWSSTNDTSAARLFSSFAHQAGPLSSISHVTQVVTRPSGKEVATFS